MSTYDDRDTALTHESRYAEAPGAGVHQGAAPRQPLPPQQPYYGGGYGMPYGMGRGPGMLGAYRHRGWSETKPFFMTSEFLGTLLCILGVCITAATAAGLDARGGALFCTILVAAYTISRGIAKAGTRSRATDPRDDLQYGTHDRDQ